MRLSDVFDERLCWPDLKARTKPEIIRELAIKIADETHDVDSQTIAEILTEREKLGSTGIQDGIAIPHGKLSNIKKIIVACGISPKSVDFESHDGKPTNIFFVLLAPKSAIGQHLKILAHLSKILKNPSFRRKLSEAEDSRAIYNCLIEENKKL